MGAIHAGDFKLLEFFEDGRLIAGEFAVGLDQMHEIGREGPDGDACGHVRRPRRTAAVASESPTMDQSSVW